MAAVPMPTPASLLFTRSQRRELLHILAAPEEYIDRRTVSVSYPGTRDIIRKTTLDGTIPTSSALPPLGIDGQGRPLVPFPIGFGTRGTNLVGFSLTLNGKPASLMTRDENQRLTYAALGEAVATVTSNPTALRLVQELTSASDPTTGSAAFRSLVEEARRPEEADLWDLLFPQEDVTSDLAQMMKHLASNYVMYARVPQPHDEDARFMLSWEVHLPHEADGLTATKSADTEIARLQRAGHYFLIQWPRIEIEFDDVALGRSSHLEIVLPDGVDPVSNAVEGAGVRGPVLIIESREQGREQARYEDTSGLVEVAGGRQHFASTSNMPVASAAAISLPVRPSRAGWLAASASLTLLATALSISAAYTVATGNEQADSFNTILAALVSVGSVTAAKRDSHELVNRVQRTYRYLLVGMSLILLVAAIASPALSDNAATALWSVSALAAGTFLILQSVAFFTRRQTRRLENLGVRGWWLGAGLGGWLVYTTGGIVLLGGSPPRAAMVAVILTATTIILVRAHISEQSKRT